MKKKNTTIIAAFGCLGKTSFANKYHKIALDIESSPYQYDYQFEVRSVEKLKGQKDRVLNKDYPDNYVKKIIENIGKYEYILIVLAREVMTKLDELGIDYTIVYPSMARKEKILKDACNRGNCQEYIERLDCILSTADDLEDLKKSLKCKDIVIIENDGYIEDYIKSLNISLPGLDEPVISGGFEHHGKYFKTEFFDIKDKKNIPILPWAQVYAIGNYRNKVPIVKYRESRDNLPGGGIYVGESMDDALSREIKEELNMRVLSWTPLGYQKVSDEVGNIGYQLRVYAKLEKIGDFVEDLDGSVIGYELVKIEELNERIKYGDIGEWLVGKVMKKYGQKT